MLSNATILVIRHGEKTNPCAKDAKGQDPFLDTMGWERSQRYVEYFQNYEAAKADGSDAAPITLTHLFAASDNLDTSYRPHETIQTLADATKLPFDVSVADANYAALVSELAKPQYDEASVLVCWHHGEIMELANALLMAGGQPAPVLSPDSAWPAENSWPCEVFGWVLQIRYDSNGTTDAEWVRCINERLMPDDIVDPPGTAEA